MLVIVICVTVGLGTRHFAEPSTLLISNNNGGDNSNNNSVTVTLLSSVSVGLQ